MVICNLDLKRLKTLSMDKPDIFDRITFLNDKDKIIDECFYILDNHFANISNDEISIVYKVASSMYFSKKLYEEAIYNATRALDVISNIDYSKLATELYILIAKSYQNLTDINKALVYYAKAISNNYIVNDPIISVEIISNIAFLYYYLNNYKTAYKYFMLCKNSFNFERDKNYFVTSVLNFDFYIVFCYLELNQIDEAKAIYDVLKNKVFPLDSKMFYDVLLLDIESRFFEYQKDYKASDEIFVTIDQKYDFVEDEYLKLYIFLNRIDNLFKRGIDRNYNEIESLLFLAEEIARPRGDNLNLSRIYSYYMELYTLNKNVSKLFTVYKKYTLIIDKLEKLYYENNVSAIESTYQSVHTIREKVNFKDNAIDETMRSMITENEKIKLTEEKYFFNAVYGVMSEIANFTNYKKVLFRFKEMFENIMFLDQITILGYNIKKSEFKREYIGANNLVTELSSDRYDALNLILKYLTNLEREEALVFGTSEDICNFTGENLYTEIENKLVSSLVAMTISIVHKDDTLICFYSSSEDAYKTKHVDMIKLVVDFFQNVYKNNLKSFEIEHLDSRKKLRFQYFDNLNDLYYKKVYCNTDGVTGLYNHKKFEKNFRMLFSTEENRFDYFISLTYISVIVVYENGQIVYPKKIYQEVANRIKEDIDSTALIARISDELFAVAMKSEQDDAMFAQIKKLSSNLMPFCGETVSINISYLSTKNIYISNYYKIRNKNLLTLRKSNMTETFSLVRDVY